MSGRANAAPARRGEAVVIFRACGQRFIISSAEIAEVRDLPPGASGRLPRVIATRGNLRQLPVVAADSIFGARSVAGSPAEAAVASAGVAPLLQLLVLAHRGVAVVIERIEGVTELREMVALPRAFHGPERRWYRGLALLEGRILPVVNAAVFGEYGAFLTPTEAAATAGGHMKARAEA
jgi:chemotaxis signal transduction protein